jgi:hypothetical protein
MLARSIPERASTGGTRRVGVRGLLLDQPNRDGCALPRM